MSLSNCAVCGKKKSTYIKNKELSNDYFKINKIVKNFLLTGDKFMRELNLKQPGFTYNACRPFSKHRGRIQNFRETSCFKTFI